MLQIYSTMIDALRMLRPVLVAIERHDSDLGKQLRRAASSVARERAIELVDRAIAQVDEGIEFSRSR